MADLAAQLKIDVDRRTTRGRSCPRCGGKIIPSRRAVYQSAGDPNDVFPSWQCERCGYEELIARPVKAGPNMEPRLINRRLRNEPQQYRPQRRERRLPQQIKVLPAQFRR